MCDGWSWLPTWSEVHWNPSIWACPMSDFLDGLMWVGNTDPKYRPHLYFVNSPHEAHRNKGHEMEAFAFCLLAITLTGKLIFCVAEALLFWGIYQRRLCRHEFRPSEVFVRWPETTRDVWNISDRICHPSNKITSFLSCYCTYMKNTKTSWHNF